MISHIGTQITRVPYPEHTHPCYEISYIRDGEGYMLVGNEKIPFKSGSIFVIPPKSKHMLYSEHGHTATSMLSRAEALTPIRSIMHFEDNEYRDGLAIVDIMCRNNLSHSEYLQKLGDALNVFILKNLDISKSLEQHLEVVDKILEEINTRFSEFDLDVNQILVNTGYAPDYMRQIFKSITGTTPTKHLINVRIEHAKNLLSYNKRDYKITEAATKSGFVDFAHFSKMFKKKCGCTPSAYQSKYGLKEGYDEKIQARGQVSVWPEPPANEKAKK